VAQTLDIPRSLLRIVPPDESVATMDDYLQSYTHGFLRAFTKALHMPDPDKNDTRTTLASAYLWMTDDEYRDAMERIYKLLNPYRDPRGLAGEREHAFMLATYDTRLAGDERAAEEKERP